MSTDLLSLRALYEVAVRDEHTLRAEDVAKDLLPLIAELSAARPSAALLVRAREALSEIVALCVDPEDKRVDLAKNLVLACGIAKEALVAIGVPEGRV